MGRKIGKRELTIGPMQNINFPYILLGRAIYYAQAISNRSHAIRDTLKMDNDFQLENIFDSESRKELEKVHNKLRSKEKLSDDMIKEYRKVILDKYLAYN